MKILIPRTGGAPLAFEGTEVETVETDQSPPSGRTVRITLYTLDRGGYVAHVHFTSQLGFEPDVHVGVGPQDSVHGLAAKLSDVKPGDYMIKSKDPYIDQVRHMLNNKYQNAITELLKNFPEEI